MLQAPELREVLTRASLLATLTSPVTIDMWSDATVPDSDSNGTGIRSGFDILQSYSSFQISASLL